MAEAKNSKSVFRIGSAPYSETEYERIPNRKRWAKSVFRNGIRGAPKAYSESEPLYRYRSIQGGGCSSRKGRVVPSRHLGRLAPDGAPSASRGLAHV
jgi:hypothetical protein